MLLSLSLTDFVIVPELTINLEGGFTALTGETGAGKSILIDALQLLLGARADTVVIREGAKKTEVSGIFSQNRSTRRWLTDNGFEPDDDEILMRRVLDASGRSRAWINGSPATVSQMRTLGEKLVDIHGQHANQSLLKPAEQLRLLDAHGGLFESRKKVRRLYQDYQIATDALQKANARAASLQDELEKLAWMKEDLDALAPEKGEWERVSEEHTKLSNASEIISGISSATAELVDDDVSAQTLLGNAYQKIISLSRFDSKLEDAAQQLSDASSIVNDTASTLRQYLDGNDLDEERLAALDSRLSAYYDTARKFHVRPEELKNLHDKVNTQISEIQPGFDTESLRRAAAQAKAAFMREAEALSASRRTAAQSLSKLVTEAMQKLSMEGGRLEVSLSPSEPGPHGLEHCDFLVAGHEGVSPRALTKVASGGELSRISLAISVITARATPVETMIFDEIDAGIGGAVAEVVGRLLQQLGHDRQVLCVTHQPQVASCAIHHLHVEKKTVDGKTVSSLTQLDSKGRIEEIARMLGGIHMTQATLDHAKEMLRLSSPQSQQSRETH